MTFPQYENYKATGTDYCGEIPRHWEIKRLGHLCKKIGSGKTPSGGAETYVDNGVLFLRSQNVYDEGLHLDEVVYISDKTDLEMQTTRVFPGDILLNITGASLGRTCLVPDDFCPANVNQHVCIVRPEDVHLRCFIAMVLKSANIKAQIVATQTGAARDGLNFRQIASLAIPLPPPGERPNIVTFIERELAKIDALVDEQGQLIELLKEKRQAVISHAVTKGLVPNVPMKDSGVEWLGEVPKHWMVGGIKRRCSKITDGAHISPETESGIYCFVSTKDVLEQGIDFDGCLRTSSASYEYLVRTGCRPLVGDVLFSKDGTIGRTVVVTDVREFVVASSLIIIRPDSAQLDPGFLHYLCQSAFVRGQVDSYVKGAGLPRLSIQNLLRVIGVFPPPNEQTEIAAYLGGFVGKLDDLIKEADTAIDLLRERRSALISSAVTGKIDVCGLIPAEAEAA